jgi:NitT/TauT family transport system permease protein
VPPAIGIVYSRIFAKVAYTFIVPLQTIPSVALAPLIVLWFGYGLLPKLLVACLISFSRSSSPAWSPSGRSSR